MDEATTGNWLALMMGNSHLHWGWFENGSLKQSWDTAHLSPEAVDCLIQHKFDFSQCGSFVKFSGDYPAPVLKPLWPVPLWIASVVPSQTRFWQSSTAVHLLSLEDIPMQGLYPSMGIDRALALWGAATSLGLPALVIDAGTGLTFTGADATGQLVGGAILPGLGLQLRSLTEHTAALPAISEQLDRLRIHGTAPARWATSTPEAMLSGVLYGLLAGIDDFIQTWLRDYPTSTITLTGGDSHLLFHLLQQPESPRTIRIDPHLVFWGMRAVVEAQTRY